MCNASLPAGNLAMGWYRVHCSAIFEADHHSPSQRGVVHLEVRVAHSGQRRELGAGAGIVQHEVAMAKGSVGEKNAYLWMMCTMKAENVITWRQRHIASRYSMSELEKVVDQAVFPNI